MNVQMHHGVKLALPSLPLKEEWRQHPDGSALTNHSGLIMSWFSAQWPVFIYQTKNIDRTGAPFGFSWWVAQVSTNNNTAQKKKMRSNFQEFPKDNLTHLPHCQVVTWKERKSQSFSFPRKWTAWWGSLQTELGPRRFCPSEFICVEFLPEHSDPFWKNITQSRLHLCLHLLSTL